MKIDGRRARGILREDAIVDAARALFIAHGYHGTTLAAIIARSGGSRETIYRAFGDKRGLLGAIIARVGDPIAAAIDRHDPARPVRDVLRSVALDLTTFWSSPEGRAMNQIILSEGSASPEILDVWYRKAVEPSSTALARYFAGQRDLGRLRFDDSGVVARQFLLLLMAEAAFATVLASSDEPAGTIVDRTVDLILRSCGA